MNETHAIRDQYMYSNRQKTLDVAPLLQNVGGRQDKKEYY